MRTIILSLVALLFITGNICARNYNIPQIRVSTEKIKENGVVKYVHHVQRGETIYAISKAYGVTTQEILNNNPTLKSGLHAGMMIFIPVKNPGKNDGKEKQLRKHIAKWYETIDDVARKYNVPVKDLMEFNNLTSQKLSRRQVLFIPDKKSSSSTTDPVEKEDNNTHNLSDKNKDAGLIAEQARDTVETGNITGNIPANIYPLTGMLKRRSSYEPVEISIILPLNGSDSLALNYNFMDFYAGALLAINKLKEQGINMKINIFDQTASSVKNLMKTDSLYGSQLIIGPVRGHDIKDILDFSKYNGIPVISPMDQSAEQFINGNPYLIQVPSGSDTQIDNILSQLKSDYLKSYGNANIILCYEKDGADAAAVKKTENYLENNSIPYSGISYGILEGREILDSIKSVINYSKKNLVIVPSNSEAFVNDIVRNLNLCLSLENKDHALTNISLRQLITLYGLPKWKNFETVDPEYFHKLNLHLSLPYHIDYNEEEVKEFLLKFRALYKTEPSPYAFQGYDIIKYFVPQLNDYGKEFVNVMQMQNGKMLQSDYSFSREDINNGFGNKATRNIKYNQDYSISTITGTPGYTPF